MLRPRGRLRRRARARGVHRPEPHDARATEGTFTYTACFLPEAVKMSPRNARGRPPAAAAGKRHVECPFLSRDSTSNTLTRVFPPLARISQPRVLAVIAAWHAADDPESASAIPRTRSKTPPGPLEEVAGKPMVLHAWHAAHAAKCVTRCVVATDDDAVETTALAFGARVVRVDDTKTKTKNEKNRNRFFGSVAGAARALAASNAAAFDVVAVVDADEAFVEAHHIERVADAVVNSDAEIATLCRPSRGEEVRRSADGAPTSPPKTIPPTRRDAST